MFSNIAKFAITLVAMVATATGAPDVAKQTAADKYVFYQGDGSEEAGWPSKPAWITYEKLFAANYPLMQKGCTNNNWSVDNSEQDIADLDAAIQQVSAETGVDARFILVIAMQESVGCLRVAGTANGVTNPGLMQSHNGAGSCQGLGPGECTYEMIVQMVRDGAGGTAHGDGLVQLLARAQGEFGGVGGSARPYYAAARLYNSGSMMASDLNEPFTSTRCYATDVADRLTGWTLAPRKCN